MARFLKKRDKSDGQSPGSLVFIGTKKMETVEARVIDYDSERLTEQELLDIKDGSHYKKTEFHNDDFHRKSKKGTLKSIEDNKLSYAINYDHSLLGCPTFSL